MGAKKTIRALDLEEEVTNRIIFYFRDNEPLASCDDDLSKIFHKAFLL